jgi:hypothetical protein
LCNGVLFIIPVEGSKLNINNNILTTTVKKINGKLRCLYVCIILSISNFVLSPVPVLWASSKKTKPKADKINRKLEATIDICCKNKLFHKINNFL